MLGDPGDDYKNPRNADQEYGDRRYDAKDPEGYFWSFATP
jgi:hypothetical protein